MGLLPEQFWVMTLGEFTAWSKHSKHQQERAWERTSAFMALVANTNRTKNSRPYKPADFNPYATSTNQIQLPSPEDIHYLKTTWPANPS